MIGDKPQNDCNLNLIQDYNTNLLSLPPLKSENNLIRNAKRRGSFNANTLNSGSLIPNLLISENKLNSFNQQPVNSRNINHFNKMNPNTHGSYKNITKYHGLSNLSKIEEEINQSTSKFIIQKDISSENDNSRFTKTNNANSRSRTPVDAFNLEHSETQPMVNRFNERLKLNNERRQTNLNSQISTNWTNEYVHTFKTLNQENPAFIQEEHRRATIDDKYKFRPMKENQTKLHSKFMIMRKRKYENVAPPKITQANEMKLKFVHSVNNLQSLKQLHQSDVNDRYVEYPDVHKRLAKRIYDQWQIKRFQNQE